MRRIAEFLVFAIVGLLLGGPIAQGAPTCETVGGATMRCGTAGAMPVGWNPTPAQRFDSAMGRPSGAEFDHPLNLILLLGAIFALLALLPPFDGNEDGDWDRQEGDDPQRR